MKYIRLTQGKHAIVDDEDYDKLMKFKWRVIPKENTFYAQRHVYDEYGKRTTQRLHNFLTGWKLTDHINGNGLDNRRENLREATSLQNNRNRIKQKGVNSSKYKGVHWHKASKKWEAKIRFDGIRKHIGSYNDELVAATAYDSFARFIFGEFGRYNFPQEGEMSALEKGTVVL